jgi:hypothetical protein
LFKLLKKHDRFKWT